VFDGVDDFIDFGNVTQLNFKDIVTLEAWIKTPGAIGKDSGILDKGQFGIDGYSLAHAGTEGADDNKIYFFLLGNFLATTTEFTDNKYHHIVATYDGAVKRIYVNGTLENSFVVAGTFDPNATNFTIGSRANRARTFNGTIDEVHIYNRVLSQDQIISNFNNGLGRYNITIFNETVVGDNWTVVAVPIDSTGVNGSAVTSNNVTILPSITQVILNSTDATNRTDENLTATVSGLSPANANVQYEWFKNGSLSAVFLGNATFQNTIPSSFTTARDVWSVNATPKILTNNYDVSNASFVDNFSVSAQDTIPQGMAFNNDGTKLYVVGDVGNDINEYDLAINRGICRYF